MLVKLFKNAAKFQQSYEKLPSLLINYFVTIKIISLNLKTTQNIFHSELHICILKNRPKVYLRFI